MLRGARRGSTTCAKVLRRFARDERGLEILEVGVLLMIVAGLVGVYMVLHNRSTEGFVQRATEILDTSSSSPSSP